MVAQKCLDIAAIGEEYKSGLSTPALAAKYGVSEVTIRNYLKRLGIDRLGKDEAARKYSANHEFFSLIDTPAKAYWLGFIVTDGTVTGNELAIALKPSDANHLEKFKKDIGSSHPVKIYQRHNTVRFTIKSTRIAKDLAALGVEANKTFSVTVPQIEKSLLPHFWRGVLDGDGSLYVYPDGKLSSLRLYGNEKIAHGFALWVSEFSGKVRQPSPHKSIYEVSYVGTRQVKVILNQLGYSSENICLDRKKAKAIQILGI